MCHTALAWLDLYNMLPNVSKNLIAVHKHLLRIFQLQTRKNSYSNGRQVAHHIWHNKVKKSKEYRHRHIWKTCFVWSMILYF